MKNQQKKDSEKLEYFLNNYLKVNKFTNKNNLVVSKKNKKNKNSSQNKIESNYKEKNESNLN